MCFSFKRILEIYLLLITLICFNNSIVYIKSYELLGGKWNDNDVRNLTWSISGDNPWNSYIIATFTDAANSWSNTIAPRGSKILSIIIKYKNNYSYI